MASEAPSKTVLLELRGERGLVREGKSVLEDRRDLLAHMLVKQLKQCEQLLTNARNIWSDARGLLRRAVMRHGRFGLANFETNDTRLTTPAWQIQNRLGTPWLAAGTEVQLTEVTGLEQNNIEISIELEAARHALRQLLEVLVPLATAQSNLTRLTDAFRRTQRRVNALEHIILPELDETIKGMEDRMDEMERDDLVRSLLIKRRQQ